MAALDLCYLHKKIRDVIAFLPECGASGVTQGGSWGHCGHGCGLHDRFSSSLPRPQHKTKTEGGGGGIFGGGEEWDGELKSV